MRKRISISSNRLLLLIKSDTNKKLQNQDMLLLFPP